MRQQSTWKGGAGRWRQGVEGGIVCFIKAGRRENSRDAQENPPRSSEASRGDLLGNGSLCRLAEEAPGGPVMECSNHERALPFVGWTGREFWNLLLCPSSSSRLKSFPAFTGPQKVQIWLLQSSFLCRWILSPSPHKKQKQAAPHNHSR